MKHALIVVAVAIALAAAGAVAQTCIVTAPVAPPVARRLVIDLPIDGGAVGCTAFAIVAGGVTPTVYPIGNAKCAQAVAIALQAAANDNGWSDGGTP